MRIVRYFTSFTLLVSCGLTAMNNNPKVLAVKNAGSYEAYLAAQIPALQNYPHIKNKIQKYINVETNERKTEYEEYQKLKKEVAYAANHVKPYINLCCGVIAGGLLFYTLMNYTLHKPDPIKSACVGLLMGGICGLPLILLPGLRDKNIRKALNFIREHPSLYFKFHEFDPQPFYLGLVMAGTGTTLGRIMIWLDQD